MTKTTSIALLSQLNPFKTDGYVVKYRCENCYHVFPLLTKKGTPAPRTAECPNCECDTGRKL